MKMIRQLALIVAVLGVIGVAVGGVFIWQGIAKNNLIVDRMKIEKVSLAVDPKNPKQLTQVTDAASAQKVADKIAADRRAIAPTYQDMLAGGRFDPTNPKEVSYAQAMNLENYLYMAVMAFGLTQSVMGSGAYMVVTGLAVILIGLALFRFGGQKSVEMK
ncbi:MAG: hypothetical protein ABR958_04900 [Dehalococcoidales bacterium]